MGLISPYPKSGKAFFYGLSQVMGYEGYVLRGCRLYLDLRTSAKALTNGI